MSAYYSDGLWVYKWGASVPCAGINIAVRLAVSFVL